MRYQVRWSNGYWKTFDSIRFEDLCTHDTFADAERAVADLNLRRN